MIVGASVVEQPMTLLVQGRIKEQVMQQVKDHGGNRTQAVARFGIAPDRWLDLSTGINPFSFPLPPLQADDWTRLPDADLEQAAIRAARQAYGVPDRAGLCLAPGSQALIQMLPLAWRRQDQREGVIWVLGPTYAEHARCWTLAGYRVEEVHADHPLFRPGSDPAALPPDLRGLVVVNPDNPSGRVLPLPVLDHLRQVMAARDGLLVCDEAFADVDPSLSCGNRAGDPGLVVLRSFGKFYGLAGVRLGAAAGEPALMTTLSDLIGPWAVCGPALRCAVAAFGDTGWAEEMRGRLAGLAIRLDSAVLGSDPDFRLLGGTTLFRLYAHPRAAAVYDRLGRAGILVRRFDRQPDWIRIGLADEAGVDRLAEALRGEEKGL